MLAPRDDTIYPFSFVILLDNQFQRDLTRSRLIDNNIYPSVLWSLDYNEVAKGTQAESLSNRMLSIHCDARYCENDMEKIVVILKTVSKSI